MSLLSPFRILSGVTNTHISQAPATQPRLGRSLPIGDDATLLTRGASYAQGVATASLLFGMVVAHATVNYAVTRPGRLGLKVAFVAEALISFVVLLTVLRFPTIKS